MTDTTQVYRIFIKTTAQAVWDAITEPEWTKRYGYGGSAEYDLRPGGAYRTIADEQMQAAGMPEVVVDGEVIEADPPHRLVQTWRARWNDEGTTKLTYEIRDARPGVVSLTVIHELETAPQTADMVGGRVEGGGGGWAEVISDLKTLLETGHSLNESPGGTAAN